MKKVIVIVLVFLSVLAIILRYGSKPFSQFLGMQSRAGLRVESNQKAKVLINDKEAGNTPYQDENLAVGEYLITLKSEEGSESGKVSWQGYAKLNAGTLTVVNRELAETKSAQSGEIITLEKGNGATVISAPSGAEVMVDGEIKGRTPITIPDLKPGEHQFILSKDNFVKRSIRATLLEGYNLVLAVDLAIAEADLTKLPVIPISQTPEVVVRQTPTGFLNMRETASTNGKIVTRVSPGDTLTLLEEKPNWDRVRTSQGQEGWVASSYVEKKGQ